MLFTGHGDSGYTSVIGGPALLKCDVRLEALGALDEAQAHLGMARALLAGTPWAGHIERVEVDLRFLMAECAIVPKEDFDGCFLTLENLSRLESDLAAWETIIGSSNGFATPGSSIIGAHLHLARTVVRRAERQVIALSQEGGIANRIVPIYLNRLSSWVYALAMLLEKVMGE